jgi:RNA-directed DNA polymerase
MERETVQHEEVGLWEIIFSRSNLFRALERVQANGGAPGVDGMTVEELPEHLKAHWPNIRAKLEAGTYQPSPVRRVEIPKPKGGVRQIGIPTVQDRLIQQAMHQILSLEYEPRFSQHSYGFRPGRSAQDAVKAAQGHIETGYRWVVDIDLAKFFDTVNHDRLMARMKGEIADKRVLRLVNDYLKAGVMVNGVVMETEEGTPQGGPLSPLLSNIVLDELDRELEKRGHRFVRYADDCNIYVQSQRAGERVKASVTRYIEKKLRLKVNEEKSAVDLATKRQFLGFSFYWRAGGVGIRIARHSLERIKRKVKKLTRRSQGRSWEGIRDKLHRSISGWVNYYALADARNHMQHLDEWLRRRMRQLAWKQWKTSQNRYKNLKARGVSEYWAKRAGGGSLGTWRMSKTPPIHQALSNAYWRKVGLVSFLEQYELRHTWPNRRMRTRMSGGVGGRGLITPSYPDYDPRRW